MNSDKIIDQALINMFQKLPPEVAERVRQKFEADRNEFMQVVKDMLPTNDAAYWAKRSCTKCQGRGIIGSISQPNGGAKYPSCPCTSKKYKNWLKDVRQYYNALKAQNEETGT